MKRINIFTLLVLSFIVISCRNKAINLKLEKSNSIPQNIKSYILDYTFVDDGEGKDTLIINTPITFHLINNSEDKFVFEEVNEMGYDYVPYVIIDGKKYNTRVIFDSPEKIHIYPKKTSQITYFFQTPILKKTLEEEFKIRGKLNDQKLGDSIVIDKITQKIQKEIDRNTAKDMFIIKIGNVENNKGIGIRYCFNKDKATIYDVDSLVKANPRYRFSCD